MSFEVDEDILQDFLVEAGEILELLSEQLVELENNPEEGTSQRNFPWLPYRERGSWVLRHDRTCRCLPWCGKRV